jgi:hypothetical protein
MDKRIYNLYLNYGINKRMKITESKLTDIDKETTYYETEKDMIEEYSSCIEDENEKKNMSLLLVDKQNNEKQIIYKFHLIAVQEISYIDKFYNFLDQFLPGYAKTLEKLNEKKFNTQQEYYEAVRDIYSKYNEVHKKLKLPPAEKILKKNYQEENIEEYTGNLLEPAEMQKKKTYRGGNF